MAEEKENVKTEEETVPQVVRERPIKRTEEPVEKEPKTVGRPAKDWKAEARALLRANRELTEQLDNTKTDLKQLGENTARLTQVMYKWQKLYRDYMLTHEKLIGMVSNMLRSALDTLDILDRTPHPNFEPTGTTTKEGGLSNGN